jgi:hypothetical protein
MKIVVTAIATAAICFGISAGAGLGSSTTGQRSFTLRPGDHISMREIAWTCRYVNATAGTVFSCNSTQPGTKVPIVAFNQAHAEVFGNAPTVARVPGGGGFFTFRVK